MCEARERLRVTGPTNEPASSRLARALEFQAMILFNPDRLETIRPWLVEHVCPFWRERITDPAGGFFHELDATGAPVRAREHATLVQARLTYVFSHAYLLNK